MTRAASLIVLTAICLQATAFRSHFQQHTSSVSSYIGRQRQSNGHFKTLHSTTQDGTDQEQKQPKSQRKEEEVSRFLTDFRTANGNLVDPYKVLKISRSASSVEIKQSYRKLSRKWHPDAVAQKEILPGKCANLEEVREEWEKVKLSYEILIDRKTRLKYDRNSVVADPGAAMGRAVGGAVGNAVGGVFSWGVESVFKIVAGEKKGGDKVDG